MSGNFPNSHQRPKLTRNYRFLVLYEDNDTGEQRTYGVWAPTSSVATARTITFIKDSGHHGQDWGYTLLPRISKDKADYEIN